MKVDLIIPWVNSEDVAWQESKRQAASRFGMMSAANTEVRYQNWNNLHYWFRTVEKNMPWFNKIVLVTCGQVPDFLRLDHPKLLIVNHEDYIPAEYLPTFNSNVIELNYHRIEGLEENFVLFNDDFFPLLPIPKEYYFRDGLPCDEAVESPIMPVDIGILSDYSNYLKANNVLLINRHFKKREVQDKNWDKWFNECYGDLLTRNERLNYWYNFAGFHDFHLAVSMRKSTFQKLWEAEPQLLDSVCHNHFRAVSDISQYAVRYWNLCEGDFIPRKSVGIPYNINIGNYKEIAQDIRNRISQMICLSEDCTPDEFMLIREEINCAFADIFPEKSSFEL